MLSGDDSEIHKLRKEVEALLLIEKCLKREREKQQKLYLDLNENSKESRKVLVQKIEGEDELVKRQRLINIVLANEVRIQRLKLTSKEFMGSKTKTKAILEEIKNGDIQGEIVRLAEEVSNKRKVEKQRIQDFRNSSMLEVSVLKDELNQSNAMILMNASHSSGFGVESESSIRSYKKLPKRSFKKKGGKETRKEKKRYSKKGNIFKYVT